MDTLKEYFEYVQTPVRVEDEQVEWDNPKVALALLMVFGHGDPEVVSFEDCDLIIREQAEILWNALYGED